MARRRLHNRGRWQIERERCHIGDRDPPPANDMGDIGSVVARIMRRLGMEENLWMRSLEQEWIALVGAQVAKHARPGSYQKAHLVVFVDSSAWLNELKRYGQEELLGKLQSRFGRDKIRKVSLRADPESR